MVAVYVCVCVCVCVCVMLTFDRVVILVHLLHHQAKRFATAHAAQQRAIRSVTHKVTQTHTALSSTYLNVSVRCTRVMGRTPAGKSNKLYRPVYPDANARSLND